MAFDVNDPFLYAIAFAVIAFVIAESVYFLIKSWRRALSLGVSKTALRRVAASSALFTLAPAVAILLGVITLSRFLGLPLPWLRLSVVGALTYELPAATVAASAMGVSSTQTVTDPRVYSTIAWVMTLGIIPSIALPPFLLKKIQGGVLRVASKDSKWGDAFMSALFLGMISAFLGMIFADIRTGLPGWIPVLVMLCSAAIMGALGLLYKRYKIAWLENYALPLSMLAAMALSIPITNCIR